MVHTTSQNTENFARLDIITKDLRNVCFALSIESKKVMAQLQVMLKAGMATLGDVDEVRKTSLLSVQHLPFILELRSSLPRRFFPCEAVFTHAPFRPGSSVFFDSESQ